MIQNFGTALSRDEMKNVIGGQEEASNKCAYACTSDTGCDTTCPTCEKGAWGDQKFCFN